MSLFFVFVFMNFGFQIFLGAQNDNNLTFRKVFREVIFKFFECAADGGVVYF